MSVNESNAEPLYHCLVNDEGQYSIWPLAKALPPGWRSAGKQGDKASCLGHINEVWTDMRPLSLQRQMAASAN